MAGGAPGAPGRRRPRVGAATLAQTAAVVREALAGAALPAPGDEEQPRQRIPPRIGGGDLAPLSFSQERMWFLDQLDPGTPIYNLFNRVDGPVS